MVSSFLDDFEPLWQPGPVRAYSEIRATAFSKTCSWVSVYRIAATPPENESISAWPLKRSLLLGGSQVCNFTFSVTMNSITTQPIIIIIIFKKTEPVAKLAL